MRPMRVSGGVAATVLLLAWHGAAAGADEGSPDTCQRGENGKCVESNMFTDSWSIYAKALGEDYMCHSVCSLQRSLRF